MSRHWSFLVSLLAVVLSLMNSAQAGEATADTFVRGAENGDTNYGTGGSVTIKNANGDSYDRKGYLRFDVSGMVSDASLDLTVSTNNNGGGGTIPQTFTVEVYGLAESLDHTWIEDEITWNNAPGNDTSSSELTADATLLGSFIVDPLPVGNPVSFSDPNLIDFINSDTDNQITLILRRTAGTSSSHNLAFASKESTSGYSPPTLNMKVATQASAPNPAHGAEDVSRDVTLAWMAGEFAATHDVYFGTSFDDVNDADRSNPMDVLVSQGQSESSYDPEGLLEYGQTYYWRIDEVNAAPDNTIFKGDVWSFTTEPLGYPIENIIATASASNAQYGPELTVDGSGLNDNGEHSTESADMWQADASTVDSLWLQYEFDQAYKLYQLRVWNYNVLWESLLGFGVKDVTIESSADGETWTTLGDFEFAQAPGAEDYAANTTVDLAGIRAQYVRLIISSSQSGSTSCGLSEVQFLYSPVQARYPDPTDGQTDVAPDSTLRWRAGREAVSHEIYLSTDEAAVADGSALVDTTTETSYSMATLGIGYGRTYFWKINEVNEAEPIPSWESAVWSFSTEAFFVVDDFEGYDDADNVIYDAWIDGWINGTGSTVGYLTEPFAERTVVHSGGQSMPLMYDNSFSPYYSEGEYDLGGMDLTANGTDTLQLYVHGDATNTAEPLYVALADSSGQTAVVSHPDTAVIQGDTWVEWQIPLSEFDGVNLAAVSTVYIGVGDRDNPSAGGSGTVFIDDVGVGHPAQ